VAFEMLQQRDLQVPGVVRAGQVGLSCEVQGVEDLAPDVEL
jgi:hypothetical protein